MFVQFGLGSGVSPIVSSEQYNPVTSSSGAGVINEIGLATAVRIGNVVRVVGNLSFTPAAPGVAETITVSLPLDMQPAANFANTFDAIGISSMGGVVPATDGVTAPVAVVGAKTMSFSVTGTGGAARVIEYELDYVIA